ncbi:hypothetical protein [Streptomyces griseocarneus]|uniref:hypothetical protein n=1 Tax=Streptomyces griseocarneus TaxID=51201 RepID=UPI00167F1AFA|nr:hypothetical protein [Streptomyces griseocarneus]MBZ6474377.1 hypothetical protein [Streptomyces griseocarneus]GHG68588.1 hypothetical protein GCM10018779_41530 [Streptomyces griseocarneus]
MSDLIALTVQVQPAPDSDLEELADLTGRLRVELLELDVDAVEPARGTAPGQAKGVGALLGWLAVQLRTAEILHTLVTSLRNWARRTDRTVEVSIDGDTLKITGATSEQQEQIIRAWLARHASGA